MIDLSLSTTVTSWAKANFSFLQPFEFKVITWPQKGDDFLKAETYIQTLRDKGCFQLHLTSREVVDTQPGHLLFVAALESNDCLIPRVLKSRQEIYSKTEKTPI